MNERGPSHATTTSSGNSVVLNLHNTSPSHHSSTSSASIFDVHAVTQSQLRPFCIPVALIFALGVLNLIFAIIVLCLILTSKEGFESSNSSVASLAEAVSEYLSGSATALPQ